MKPLAPKLRKLAAELIALADQMQAVSTAQIIGDGKYNRATGLFSIGRKKHLLTRAQAKVLDALFDNRGVCLSREDLLCVLFGSSGAQMESRTVDMHVCELRRIIGDHRIRTVHGRGYCYEG